MSPNEVEVPSWRPEAPVDELRLSAMAGRQLPFFSLLVPTWLVALGELIPDGLEGRVLDGLFCEESEWRRTASLSD